MGLIDTVAAIPINANLTLRLKDAEAAIATLKQEKIELQARLEKSEQDRQALEEQIKDKLAESHDVRSAFNAETGTWFDAASSLHYCAKCKASGTESPMTSGAHGWKCPVCNAYAADPKRPEPPFRRPTRAKTWI
jgi:DNA repair exonuclease SbcCD ATPase subunit